jgi:hypothetical protein
MRERGVLPWKPTLPERDTEDCAALDIIHGASVHLDKSFHVDMPRDEAKSNLDARVILFNCANIIFGEHNMKITREEISSQRERLSPPPVCAVSRRTCRTEKAPVS